MERITITIEGSSEEVIRALQAVAAGVGRRETSVTWLPNEIRDFFSNLQPEAQRILREIATRPAGYNRDDLVSELGISGRGLAGRLSSVGNTLRNFYPMKPRPINLNDDTWNYTMLPEFVDWFASNR